MKEKYLDPTQTAGRDFVMRLIYFLFLFPLFLLAQPRQVQTYTVAEGLAQSQVYAVLADRRGYVWAGTQGGGLSRFDGVRFRTFSDGDGLPGNYVQALWEDMPGNLWIGTDLGLARYDGQTFTTFLPGVNILAIDGRNRPEEIWVLTEAQLYRRQGTSWDTLALPLPYLRPYCMVVEAHRLLLGTDRGAWQWDGQSWRTMPAVFAASHQVWALFRYQRGQTWALAPGNQLFTVGPDSLRARRVPAQTPTVFYVSPEGDSWLGTQDQGVFLLPKGGQSWVTIGKQQGLRSNHIRALTGDRWGNIWVGTSGGGLSCLRRAPFQAFDQDRGLPGKEVYGVAVFCG
jgi:ligand-binding sensor domain-containing protein